MQKAQNAISNILIIIFFLLVIPNIAQAMEIMNVTDYPDPLKANSTYITIKFNVTTDMNQTIDKALIFLTGPNLAFEDVLEPVSNKTYTVVVQTNQSGNLTNTTTNITEFTFTYWPEIEGTYWYRAFVNDTNGNSTYSSYYSFSALRYPLIHAVHITTPVNYTDDVLISITAYILPWDGETITNVTAEIISPNGTAFNLTMNFSHFDGTYYVYNASFHPDVYAIYVIDHWEREYRIRVFATDNTSSTSVSDFYTARAEDYVPEVVDVAAYPPAQEFLGVAFYIPTNNTLVINITTHDVTSATNLTSNINKSQLILTSSYLGLYEVYNLTLIDSNESYKVYNWSFNYTTPHILYEFRIYLEDTHGNKYLSQPYFFSDDIMTYRIVPLELNVSEACCLLPVVIVSPKVMYEGQTFTIYTYVENCGSVPVNVSGGVDIYKIRGKDWIHYETVAEQGEYAFYNLKPGEIAGTYYVRSSADYDEGNYSAVLDVNYYADVCFNRTNGTDFFEIKKFGGHGPMDLIVIREMPSSITQPKECETNPDACNTLQIRLFLYNRGAQNITNVTFTDTIQLNISLAHPNPDVGTPVKVVCNSTYAYNCSVEMKKYTPYDPTVAIIQVNLTQPILPRNYVMVSYNLTPASNLTVYNETYETKYTFIVQGTFTDSKGQTQIFLERMPYFNPPESYTLELVDEKSFDYNIFVNNNSQTNLTHLRSFYALKPATLEIVAKSISGDHNITGSYFVNVSIPPIWKINGVVDYGDCDAITYQNYDFTHLHPYVVCNTSKPLKNGDTITFSINITSFIDEMFLLPAEGANMFDLSSPYIPGFFVVAMRPQNETQAEKPKPEPQPTPQPTPQPVPQPVPMPQPQPKIEIVLTPIKDEYTAYQDQLIPTYFTVENIGNATAYNVTIEPELPSGDWRYSPTYVDVLRPGEKVNRTLMIAPSIDTPPGLYVIPVKAIVDGEIADLAYIKVHVLFGKHLAKIEIVEAPTEVEIEEFSNLTIPVLLKNVGRKKLHNVTMRLENVEECLSFQNSSMHELDVNETVSATLFITAKDAPKTCRAVLIVSSREEAYAFAPVLIKVNPRPPLMPLQWKWAPYLALGWTTIFLIYGAIRKRKARMGERPRTIWPRVFIYTLLIGELLIIIYVMLWIFGYVASMI